MTSWSWDVCIAATGGIFEGGCRQYLFGAAWQSAARCVGQIYFSGATSYKRRYPLEYEAAMLDFYMSSSQVFVC